MDIFRTRLLLATCTIVSIAPIQNVCKRMTESDYMLHLQLFCRMDNSVEYREQSSQLQISHALIIKFEGI
jgi:hypothetical protein